MTNSQLTPGIVPGRLPADTYAANFADIAPRLTRTRRGWRPTAAISAMMRPASPPARRSIDIPLFIRQIATGTPEAAAKTIFDQNILGGMCARVCPTEQLCEEACVREAAEGKPVEIGRLQRFATDTLMDSGRASVHARPRRPASAWRWSARGRQVWPRRTGWR